MPKDPVIELANSKNGQAMIYEGFEATQQQLMDSLEIVGLAFHKLGEYSGLALRLYNSAGYGIRDKGDLDKSMRVQEGSGEIIWVVPADVFE